MTMRQQRYSGDQNGTILDFGNGVGILAKPNDFIQSNNGTSFLNIPEFSLTSANDYTGGTGGARSTPMSPKTARRYSHTSGMDYAPTRPYEFASRPMQQGLGTSVPVNYAQPANSGVELMPGQGYMQSGSDLQALDLAGMPDAAMQNYGQMPVVQGLGGHMAAQQQPYNTGMQPATMGMNSGRIPIQSAGGYPSMQIGSGQPAGAAVGGMIDGSSFPMCSASQLPPGMDPEEWLPNYSCVLDDRLWVGNQAAAEQPQLLKSFGITHILNMAEEVSPHLGDANFPFEYKHLPLADAEAEDCSPYLPHAFYYIEESLQKSGKVYVHCHMGISRGPTAVVYFMMVQMDWSYEKSLTNLRKRRPKANPNFGYAASIVHYVYTGASPAQNQAIRVPLDVVLDEMVFVTQQHLGGLPRPVVESALQQNNMHIERALRQLKAQHMPSPNAGPPIWGQAPQMQMMGQQMQQQQGQLGGQQQPQYQQQLQNTIRMQQQAQQQQQQQLQQRLQYQMQQQQQYHKQMQMPQYHLNQMQEAQQQAGKRRRSFSLPFFHRQHDDRQVMEA